MEGIDQKVISYKLNLDSAYTLVKQKTHHPEKRNAAEDEVDKYLATDFIRELQYPEWLANVVLVKKAGNKW